MPTAWRSCDAALAQQPSGLIFANLVDFDMLYGHRKDVEGSPALSKNSTPGSGRFSPP